MLKKVILGILSITLWCQTAFTDEILFKNGDKLTGKIKEIARNKMLFESKSVGTVTIDLSKIKTFKTDEPVEVHLPDGASIAAVIQPSDQNLFAVKTGDPCQVRELSADQIASIDRLIDGKVNWTGDISAGLTAARGNTVTDTSSLNLNLTRRTKQDRTSLSGYYIKSEQENPHTGQSITTQDAWWTKGKYDYFFTKKFYVYGEGRYERDAIADLQRRIILGSGAGRQWVESQSLNFSTDAGLASIYEKHTNRPQSSTQVSGQLGYHLDKKLNSNFTFYNDLTYYPNLEEMSDYLVTKTVELRAAITEQLFANFKVIFNRDATPAENAHKTDVKYIVGAGWKF